MKTHIERMVRAMVWADQQVLAASPIIEILTQVVIHGAYHRGQIAKIVGRSGGRAPDTDFITFVREVEPD